MKKKIAALLLAATATVMSFGMVACNDDPKAEGTEVIADAAAWKAAFDFKDVENATVSFESTADESASVNMYDGGKVCRKFTRADENGNTRTTTHYSWYKTDEIYDAEQYPDRGSAYYYEYDEDSQKWTYRVSVIFDEETPDDIIGDILRAIGMDEMFADFEYDANAGVYKAKVSELAGAKVEYATVTFKQGKVKDVDISVTYGAGADAESIKAKVSVTDLGTTKVELPQATERE